jgi:two-component system, LytTR family, response regulator
MKYRAVIVDDEPAQQNILQKMLLDIQAQIEVVEVCPSVDIALQRVPLVKPDLVFLDVHLPPKTGFDFLESCGDIFFEIIFVTSFDDYALRAFKVSAVDYLLKPYGEKDLADAVNKFVKRLETKKSMVHFETLLNNIRSNTSESVKIALPTSAGLDFVKVNDIIRCETVNSYCVFYFVDGQQSVVSRTLKECEEMLTSFQFFRVHHSHLINMRHIRQYQKGEGGQVVMADGSQVEISRRKKDEFIQQLNRL